MFTAGLLVVAYGCLILIDVAAAALGFPNVPFDVGPPLPQNWFPSLLLGSSVLGAGLIEATSARKNRALMAVIALLIAVVAMYEIVLLDRVYVRQGRPALSAYSADRGGSLQNRLDRIYSGTLRFPNPPK
jgi:hypothetical protein